MLSMVKFYGLHSHPLPHMGSWSVPHIMATLPFSELLRQQTWSLRMCSPSQGPSFLFRARPFSPSRFVSEVPPQKPIC